MDNKLISSMLGRFAAQSASLDQIPVAKRRGTLSRTSGRKARADALHKLPKRAARREAAKRKKVLPGWREARNRHVLPNGQHVVIWPAGR